MTSCMSVSRPPVTPARSPRPGRSSLRTAAAAWDRVLFPAAVSHTRTKYLAVLRGEDPGVCPPPSRVWVAPSGNLSLRQVWGDLSILTLSPRKALGPLRAVSPFVLRGSLSDTHMSSETSAPSREAAALPLRMALILLHVVQMKKLRCPR